MNRILRITVALLIALPPLSCFSERNTIAEIPPGVDCTIPGSAIGPNKAVIYIRGYAFAPDTVRIRPGGTVTWVNCEASNIEPHTSTSTAQLWNSGPIAPGESYARQFTTAGTNGFFCIPHPSMKGAIIVQ
jgi:plastocyanin